MVIGQGRPEGGTCARRVARPLTDHVSVPGGIVLPVGSDAATTAPPGRRSAYQPRRLVMSSKGLSSQPQSVTPQQAHGRVVVMSLLSS